MELFFKAAALAMVTAVLSLVLSKQEKDFALLLTMAGCALSGLVLMRFLEPVLDFVHRLQTLGDLNADMLHILLKAVGTGLVAEIAGMVCTDAGNAALGKTLQILGSIAVLWLSVPLMTSFMSLLEQILGEI